MQEFPQHQRNVHTISSLSWDLSDLGSVYLIFASPCNSGALVTLRTFKEGEGVSERKGRERKKQGECTINEK